MSSTNRNRLQSTNACGVFFFSEDAFGYELATEAGVENNNGS